MFLILSMLISSMSKVCPNWDTFESEKIYAIFKDITPGH